MQLPIIHNNGDSTNTLLQQNKNAMQVVKNAIETLALAAPNARNYEMDAFNTAKNEHFERVKKLTAVFEDLRRISQYIYNVKIKNDSQQYER